MQRLLGTAVALAVFVLQAETGAFHTHLVVDGHAGEHRHGPAIHAHDGHEEAGDGPHVDDAASTGRVVTVAVPAAVAAAGAFVFTLTATVRATPLLRCIGRAPSVVTRSHDPPSQAQHSLRGPPPFFTA